MQNSLVVENPLIVKQNDLKLYVFKLTAEEIHNHFVVSRRLEDKEEGYQRIVKEKKIKEIVAYLSGKSSDSYPSILPSNKTNSLPIFELGKSNETLYQPIVCGFNNAGRSHTSFTFTFCQCLSL